jgi:hypothetical protein
MGHTKIMKSEEKYVVEGAVLVCKNLAMKGLVEKSSSSIMPLKLNIESEVICVCEVGNLTESRMVSSYSEWCLIQMSCQCSTYKP